MKRVFVALVLAYGCAAGSTTHAQTYPVKPVKVLVPFAPGGTADIVARLVSVRLTESLGQQFLVENRGGAGGTIGTAIVAKSPADGYTLLVAHQGLAFNATLYDKLPYDTLKDLVPAAMVGSTPNVMVVNPGLPIRSVADFIAYAKASPGKLAYGSGGVGSAGHLPVELFQSLTQTVLTHVPYKGSGPALTDLMSGQVQAMILTMPAAVSYIKAGKLRAIAVSGAKRSSAMPELPTIAEAGVAGRPRRTWSSCPTARGWSWESSPGA